MTPELRKAFRFFHEHAGWCTPPGKVACALALAKAEAWAIEEGIEAVWDYDDLVWDGDSPAPDMILYCIMRYEGETESLSGIGLNHARRDEMILHRGWLRQPYQRVVEAELASQLRPRVEAKRHTESCRAYGLSDDTPDGVLRDYIEENR